MRFEFDLARKELENQTLRSSQQLQAEKLKQLQERRYWQYLVVALLLVVMGTLVVHQRGRTRKMQRLAMTDELAVHIGETRHLLFLFGPGAGDDQGLQLAMQRRALHADEGRGTGDVAAKPRDLGQQIFPLEHFAGVAQR